MVKMIRGAITRAFSNIRKNNKFFTAMRIINYEKRTSVVLFLLLVIILIGVLVSVLLIYQEPKHLYLTNVTELYSLFTPYMELLVVQ